MESLRRKGLTPTLWIFTAFALSRILYWLAGVRFDATPLTGFYQIVDPLLMKTRLFETLWYLHTQPPGFNLIIGLAVKFFPESYGAVLHAFYLVCGLILCWSLYRLMRIFSVGEGIAAGLTILFICSPGVVLFENFLMYEYPMAAILCGSAVLLHRALIGKGSAWLFFASLAALMYIRAIFHLAWFILIAAFLAWLLPGRRKSVIAAAIIPFLLVVAIYAKNVPIAGSFTSSTWLGFNADTITLHQLTDEEHARLVHEGLLSEVGLIPSTDPLSSFARFAAPPPKTGIPVLDQLKDSTGRVNYNNIGYLPLHRYYIADAKAIILHYPKAYLRSVVRACFTYFLPTGDFPFFGVNLPKIAGFNRAFDIVVFGQWRDASDRKALRGIEAAGGTATLPLYTGTYLLIGLPILILWSLVRIWKARGGALKRPENAVLIYIVFQILYTTAIVNLLSCFENNRYRLPIDAFYVAILGLALQTAVNAFRSRSGRTSPTSA